MSKTLQEIFNKKKKKEQKTSHLDSTSDRRREKSVDVESVANIKKAFNRHLHFSVIKDPNEASNRDCYYALVFTLRDLLITRWIRTQKSFYEQDPKRVYFMSLEFDMGRILLNTMKNLGITATVEEALNELRLVPRTLLEYEEDLGSNKGLGRLAACFLRSIATTGIPAYGYGLRYEYGIFKKAIRDGWEIGTPEEWLICENPWEKARPEYTLPVHFQGKVVKKEGKSRWVDTKIVFAIPYDTPVPGGNNNIVNTLRLWSAKAENHFHLKFYNYGDYVEAVTDRNLSENITRVLYPNDNIPELRLKQQYFLAAATLQDIIRRFKSSNYGNSEAVRNFDTFPDKVAIQLNDTHPSIGIPELIRLFVDVEGLSWDQAWDICIKTYAYANYTLLPEALERWPVSLVQNILPRHLEIIYEINHKFLISVRERFPEDMDLARRMSIIEEADQFGEKRINMAHLCIVACHATTGSQTLKSLFRDFYDFFHVRFHHKKNSAGLLLSNQPLSDIIVCKIGRPWVTNLDELQKLKKYFNDSRFLDSVHRAKLKNKERIAQYLLNEYNVAVNADSLFEVHVKRIHEYTPQLLNILHVIDLYNRIKENANIVMVKRTVFYRRDPAPGNQMAKLIIRLITAVAEQVNKDAIVGDRLKVIFLENYDVDMFIHGADLTHRERNTRFDEHSEESKEYILNGALTIGKADGANGEMGNEMNDNMFTYGRMVEEVEELRRRGYTSHDYIQKSSMLQKIVGQLERGEFTPEDKTQLRDLSDMLRHNDPFMLCADFESFIETQNKVAETYRDQEKWSRMALHNIASMEQFSSARTISEYAREIWGIKEFENSLPAPYQNEKSE